MCPCIINYICIVMYGTSKPRVPSIKSHISLTIGGRRENKMRALAQQKKLIPFQNKLVVIAGHWPLVELEPSLLSSAAHAYSRVHNNYDAGAATSQASWASREKVFFTNQIAPLMLNFQ